MKFIAPASSFPALFKADFSPLWCIAAWGITIASVIAGGLPDEIAQFASDVPKQNAGFGFSAAHAETKIAIGAPFAGQNGNGQVYLYDPATKALLDTLELDLPPQEAYFGIALVLEGNVLIVGAPGENDGGVEDRGAVYFFDLETEESWRVVDPEPGEGDYFGASLAADGTLVLIGVFGDDGDGSDRGSVLLYDTKSRQFLDRWTAPDTSDGDHFGVSLDLKGDFAIVGANTKDGGENLSDSGAAYVFKVATGQEVHRLTSPAPERESQFGLGVALSSTHAFVGSPFQRVEGPGDFFARGAVWSFDLATGEQAFPLIPSSLTGDSSFGTKIEVSEEMIAVAAPGDAAEGANTGSVVLFDATSGREILQFNASGGQADDEFARSIALNGRSLVVGANFRDQGDVPAAGAAYLYSFSGKPDLLQGRSIRNLRGNDLYSSNGSGQQFRMPMRNRTRFFLKAENDGSLIDQLRVQANRSNARIRFRYREIGGGNATAAISAGRYLTGELYPNESTTLRASANARSRNGRQNRQLVRTNLTSVDAPGLNDLGKVLLRGSRGRR